MLFETNVNAQLTAELADYLDGAPTVEKAARLYDEFRATLRKIGVVLGPLGENDLNRALLKGEDALTVAVNSHPSGDDGELDYAHELLVHLTSGTFVVNCGKVVDRDSLAHKWEESLMVAQLSGQEDTLLAYAREYVRRENKKRTKKILEERQTGTIHDD